MRYTDQEGNAATAELWSPGPLYGTVWALTPSGAPVVISVTKALEVPWGLPPQPLQTIGRDTVEMARDVLRRKRIADINASRDWYIRVHVAKEGNSTIKKPTKAQVDAARAVIEISEHNRLTYRTYREAHIASTPISAKRFTELWTKGDE